MPKRNMLKRFILFAVIAVLLIGGVAVFVNTCSDKINQDVYNASSTYLSEVYTQVRNSFVLNAQEQWSLLSVAGDFVTGAECSEERITAYLANWKSKLGFSEFFFLDSQSNYVTPDGSHGVVELGSSWKKLFVEGQPIAIDGSIPGRESMLFFAVPVPNGTYKGLSFSALAVAYDMKSLNRALGISAFDGSSSCYIVASNGRIILNNEGASDLGGNLLYHIKSSDLSAEALETFHTGLQQGTSGSFRYTCNDCGNGSWYAFYTPTGIGDWSLVAMVPSALVDDATSAVQMSLTAMLLTVFGVFAFIVVGLILLRSRQTINEKNRTIWQQDVLFRQMSDHMNDIFVLFNTDKKRVEYISPNTERIFGIPHAEAEKQHKGSPAAFDFPEQLQQLIDTIDQLQPGTSSSLTVPFTDPRSGTQYLYKVSAIRESDAPELVSIILSDRTKERDARKQIEDALIVAEHANKAKTTFLNNMSHDIRTPMNAIIGFTSLATTHIDDKALVKDYLAKIMVSGEHLLSLINDVLDMSRIESGKITIDEKETSLPVIMHDLRNILQTDIRAKRLEFYIDTVDIVHENIRCDKLRLNQVLINLMSNAMKFTPAGGTVGIRVIESAGAPEGFADFEFRVRDTGIGMSEEFAAHIFEPFTREQNSTVSKIQGTGLGMAITKNIVDLMSGSIAVNTQKGAGTEFIVSLRFATAGTVQELHTIKRLEGFRALVADDSMDCCSGVTSMLRQIGMRPEWTTSGKEAVYRSALAIKEGDPFHVYIIDWLMPDMNGIEVVRRIRQEIGSQTPIIILTAYDWSAVEKEAREAGVTAFCAKPLFMSELYSILQNEGTIPEAEVVDEYDPERFRGRNVLLVDDVELNREIAVAILEEAGISVETATNGQEAVDMVAASGGCYDLVLMDIMMPVMDGYEATRQIRALQDKQLAAIPVIAMTANAFDEDRQAALQAGMDAHLAKPFRIEQLLDLMNRFL